MHKHGFVGAQSIYTCAILANYKYICMIFFSWGAPGGGARAPQAPPPPP